MISGSHDTQTSADVSNVGTFKLPDPAGRAGGACTSALLQVLHDSGRQEMSWVTLLRTMRTVLLQMGYDQVPQLTSSRMIDVNKSFYVCPPNFRGSKRAVLIGINYTGQQGQLSGCHNDVGNILNYLKVRRVV
jgi:metacaspase-1